VTDGIFYILVLLAILGTACMAGMFFAFSVFVMRGLDRLPSPTGIAAMQSINAAVGTPLFGLAFAGTALVCLVLEVDPTAAGSEAWWRRYVAEWTTWNHVRTIASLAATGLLAVALA
jgi:uncharacterized membrane protein